MVLTYIILAIAMINILYPYCVAENSEIEPFLNKQYKLVSSDKNFDLVLKELEIGWLRRKAFEFVHPKLTLKYNPITNIYTFSEWSIATTIDVAFQVVIIKSILIL